MRTAKTPLQGERLERERAEPGKWRQADVVARLHGLAAERQDVPCRITVKLLSRWECGDAQPSPSSAELLCTLYGKTRDALGLSRPHARRGSRRNAAPGEHAESHVAPPSVAERDGSRAPEQEPQSEQGIIVPPLISRRLFGALSAGISAGIIQEAFAAGPYEVLRWLDQTNVSDETLAQHEAATTAFGLDYPNRPPHELVATVFQRLLAVGSLLREGQPIHIRQRIVRVCGYLSGLMGWLAHDMYNHAAAQVYWEAAERAGHEADSKPLIAYALASRSFLHTLKGDHTGALDLIEGAKRYAASEEVTDRTRSWLAMLAAKAYAGRFTADPTNRRRHERASRLALDEADVRMVDGRSQPRGHGHDFFDPPSLAAGKGSRYLALAQPAIARRFMREALALQPQEHARLRAMTKFDLAGAYLAERQLEEAIQAASEALDLPDESLIAPIMQRAISFWGDLEPFATAKAVRAFRDRLHLPEGHAKLVLP